MTDAYKDQFNLDKSYYLRTMDFLNWYRYFHLIKNVLAISPPKILEIGSGNGLVKNCLVSIFPDYKVLDINANFKPDFVGDLRVYNSDLANGFDCIIIADVLEHIPWEDVDKCIRHIKCYLKKNGNALITIPHRRSHFFFMTPNYVPHVITVPTGFLSFGAFYRRFIKRKIWIDPHHCWEIGDGRIKKKDIEKLLVDCGFIISSFKKLLYVDFWVVHIL